MARRLPCRDVGASTASVLRAERSEIIPGTRWNPPPFRLKTTPRWTSRDRLRTVCRFTSLQREHRSSGRSDRCPSSDRSGLLDQIFSTCCHSVLLGHSDVPGAYGRLSSCRLWQRRDHVRQDARRLRRHIHHYRDRAMGKGRANLAPATSSSPSAFPAISCLSGTRRVRLSAPHP